MANHIELFIDGAWTSGEAHRRVPFVNPASGETLGTHAVAGSGDLNRVLAAVERGFGAWRQTPAYERYRVMRRAAEHLRTNVDGISRTLTLEQGKPLAESRLEVASAADIVDWLAEEGRRAYGRVIPARAVNVQQLVIKEPVGPVAAFSPWNFPLGQAVRKIAAAVATGCSIVLKGPEETPASCAALVTAFEHAGLPPGVVNLVFGDPAAISTQLIESPVIRKVSFTGSTAVGRQLAALGGRHMKRMTMELGGHAPAIVCADADLDLAVKTLAASKFRNAGQICASPSRLLVHVSLYERFVRAFVVAAEAIRVGDGLLDGVTMGPLAHRRRLDAMEALVSNAVSCGAQVRAGGHRIGDTGFFFTPTVITEVPVEARVMNEEPFGPIAPIQPFETLEQAIIEANRLPYGLASYAWTSSASTIATLSRELECGMLSVNHAGLALAETPFGGVKDSGYGSEGGSEALEAYLISKFVTQASL